MPRWEHVEKELDPYQHIWARGKTKWVAMLIYGGMVEWWGDDKKGGGVSKIYAPNSTWAFKQYIKNQIQYQEANTIYNAYERRTKSKGFYMMLKCKVAWWHEHDIIMMQQLYVGSSHYITKPCSITYVRQMGCYTTLTFQALPLWLQHKPRCHHRSISYQNKRVLYDAQKQGGMMTWAWYNYDATIVCRK